MGADYESLDTSERVEQALAEFGENAILTSSFGIQSAAMLHLVTRHRPRIPVVFLDTQYLFPETYRFVEELTQRLNLNLITFRSKISKEQQEKRFGKLWEQGSAGMEKYNQLNKVEPLKEALKKLKPRIWFNGRRRGQALTRADIPIVEEQAGIIKVNPIADRTNKQIYYYLQEYGLPYHPLREQGYDSVGDRHSTTITERHGGFSRECGIHVVENFKAPDLIQ